MVKALFLDLVRTNQSNSLTGLISVHVVRVFANGNLEILVRRNSHSIMVMSTFVFQALLGRAIFHQKISSSLIALLMRT